MINRVTATEMHIKEIREQNMSRRMPSTAGTQNVTEQGSGSSASASGAPEHGADYIANITEEQIKNMRLQIKTDMNMITERINIMEEKYEQNIEKATKQLKKHFEEQQ